MSVFEINSHSRDHTDLGVDMSTNGMDSVSDIFPARNLVFVPESRSVRPVRAMEREHQTMWYVDAKLRDIPLGSDEGAFGDDEAGTGSSLNIILQIDMIWHSGGN